MMTVLRKFKVGDKVRVLTPKRFDYSVGFPVGTIGIITGVDIDCRNAYRVDADGDWWYYAENELELVEEKEEEEMELEGRLGVMLKCERCGFEEFAVATNVDDVELIDDLEFDSADMDRWGKIGGLSLCPKCADALNKFIDGFMSSSGNVDIKYHDGRTETV